MNLLIVLLIFLLITLVISKKKVKKTIKKRSSSTTSNSNKKNYVDMATTGDQAFDLASDLMDEKKYKDAADLYWKAGE